MRGSQFLVVSAVFVAVLAMHDHDHSQCGHEHHDDDHHAHDLHDHSTCDHGHHDDHHDHDTCDHHHHHHDDDDHSTCEHDHGHHHDHDHDHDHASDPLGDRWYAHYTDANGARHEHPVVFRARGVSYLTVFNMHSALQQAAESVLVFVYTQGCGLCEEAHSAFVSVAEGLTEAVAAATARSTTVSGAPPKDVAARPRMLFAQMDVSRAEDHDDEAALDEVRRLWTPVGATAGDYPLLVVLRPSAGTSAAQEGASIHRGVSWFTGPLSEDHVAHVLHLVDSNGNPLLTRPGDAGNTSGSNHTVMTFDDGVLVC